MIYCTEYASPVGMLLLESNGEALTGLWMNRQLPSESRSCPVLSQAEAWLDGYFRGQPPERNFPLAPKGTPFQQAVWEILLKIPYGSTRTYGDIAREMADSLGKSKMSAQAVGNAVGKNPISIVIPCHRVLGAQGQLTGYAGGLEVKRQLLVREGSFSEE